MEDDPELINDPDRQLEAKVVKQAEKYQQSRLRSKSENSIKAEGRKEIDKLGFRTDAYQASLRVARDLTPAEQKQYVRDFRFFLKVFADKQLQLWPEDAALAVARAKRKAERKAKDAAKAGGETPEQQVRRLAADSNPRSDPKRGGAGKAKKAPKSQKAASNDEPKRDTIISETSTEAPEVIVSAEKNAELEQITGAALLDTTPKAQSEIAKQKLQDAGLA